MSATRLLLLGVLSRKPLHGYELRQELEKWAASRWANVAYGSIYHALGKLNKDGLVQIVDTEGASGGPARTVYEITEAGKTEFARLLRGYWIEIRPLIDPLQVAIAFMDHLSTEELLDVLRRRALLVRAELEMFKYGVEVKMRDAGVPRHIAANMRLALGRQEVELTWLEDTIAKVESGELP
jgi:DNA-binding PadR family transcriptional regulator